jgi:hypothetical protein
MFKTQKPVSLCNLSTPKIIVTQKLISSIKHIVDIAPQEAQWFNVIESVERAFNSISIKLSDKLYIPEQICSLAEVDTNANMLVGFYRDLLKDHSVEEVNSILSNLNAWSHSHHTMGVSPSAQDQNQFEYFVTQNIQQNNNKPFLMLIFNKKGQVYSRFYDNKTGLVYQDLEIEIASDEVYDLSYIDAAAKDKFKYPPKKLFPKTSTFDFGNPFSSASVFQDPLDQLVADSKKLARQSFYSIYNSTPSKTLPVSSLLKVLSVADFVDSLAIELGDLECYWFAQLIANKYKNITFDTINDSSYLESISLKIDSKKSVHPIFSKYFKNSNKKVSDFIVHLEALWILIKSATSKDDFQEAIEYIQDVHYD